MLLTPFRLIAAGGALILGLLLINEYKYIELPPTQDRLIEIPGCPSCNVVLISLDTMRSDIASPLLQGRLRQIGLDKHIINFSRLFSPSSYSTPSHMSLFTGLSPAKHKVDETSFMFETSRSVLPPEIPTLAEKFSQDGFRTGWFAPVDYAHFSPQIGFLRGFSAIHPSPFSRNSKPDTDKLEKFLHTSQKHRSFLFVHSYLSHSPYFVHGRVAHEFGTLPRTLEGLKQEYLKEVAEEKLSKAFNVFLKKPISSRAIKEKCFLKADMTSCYSNIIDRNGFLNTLGYWFERKIEHLFKRNQETIQKKAVDTYKAAAKNNIEQTIRIVSKIRDTNPNTLIAIVGDHGEQLFEHGAIGHKTLYDHTIRVPGVLIYPFEIHESKHSIPNMLSLTQVHNVLAQIDDKIISLKPRQYIIGKNYEKRYIRSENWKLIEGIIGSQEFYHLASDPEEKKNILSTYSWLVRNQFRKMKLELDEELSP